jgi:hypothetical protein
MNGRIKFYFAIIKFQATNWRAAALKAANDEVMIIKFKCQIGLEHSAERWRGQV